MNTVKIDIVSDVVCPWCYLGKVRLERALERLEDVTAQINWRPYQLDPHIRRQGVEFMPYIVAKIGSASRVGEIQQQIQELGREIGIDYHFDKIKLMPNTMNAHRLIRWAAQVGSGIQDKVVNRLFQLYFSEGMDIGDDAILIKAGVECGMDAGILETLIPTDAEVGGVMGDIETFAKMGVSGVPFFIINQQYGVSGAQTPDVLIQAIQGAIANTTNV